MFPVTAIITLTAKTGGHAGSAAYGYVVAIASQAVCNTC